MRCLWEVALSTEGILAEETLPETLGEIVALFAKIKGGTLPEHVTFALITFVQNGVDVLVAVDTDCNFTEITHIALIVYVS
jgi:hypothetical protein